MNQNIKYKNTANQILAFIQEHDNYLISAHIHADGDAYASMVAVHLLLKTMGKKTAMVLSAKQNDQRFDFLKDFNTILPYSDQIDLSNLLDRGKIESAVVLDVPSYFRLGDVHKLLPELANILKIDHHPVEDVMGEMDWVDVKASSTTSMVYELYKQSGLKIDLEMAKALYTGILYDTGRFSYSNTTERDYAIAAEMVSLGVKPAKITNRVFFENSFDAFRTIGKGLFSLERHLDGKVCSIYLSHSDLEGQDQSEIEELANYSVSVRGADVGLFIREIKSDFHKISLRSREIVDVNRVARAFEGGGHVRASGCRIAGTRNTVIEYLLQEIVKQLP